MLRIASFLAPSVYPAYKAIAETIGSQLKMDIEFVVGDSHDQYDTLKPDVAFICGLPYVLMRQGDVSIEAIAAPVLRGERYNHQPIYFSDVIVRAEASYESFSDLRGCRWAYNEEVSQSGYGITRHTLIQMGETQGFFGDVLHVGWHNRAIKSVLRGRVDATAIDSQVLEIEMHQNPLLRQQIKIIDVLGPSTIQPVVVRSDLPAELKRKIQTILVNLHLNNDLVAILHEALFEQFVMANDNLYDDIRSMVTLAEEANFLKLK